jgi:hypothetical protein
VTVQPQSVMVPINALTLSLSALPTVPHRPVSAVPGERGSGRVRVFYLWRPDTPTETWRIYPLPEGVQDMGKIPDHAELVTTIEIDIAWYGGSPRTAGELMIPCHILTARLG